ncbi:MAG: hypothetical protein IJW45_04700 [Oscillospiraceae bacterium]|nr:hypothetical protein [Oscillospiraceae bacterium]
MVIDGRKKIFGCAMRCCADPDCGRGECQWAADYLARQRWINAFAQAVGSGRQVLRYEHPLEVERSLRDGPCMGCPVEKVCDMACPGYVRWWDMRMAYFRMMFGRDL